MMLHAPRPTPAVGPLQPSTRSHQNRKGHRKKKNHHNSLVTKSLESLPSYDKIQAAAPPHGARDDADIQDHKPPLPRRNSRRGGRGKGSVIYMGSMFKSAVSFNVAIGNWDVSSVINMSEMFNGATVFNKDLSGWCVTNITSEPINFSTSSALTNANKPVWGTCP